MGLAASIAKLGIMGSEYHRSANFTVCIRADKEP